GSDTVSQVRKICEPVQVSLVDVGGERPFNYYFTDLSLEDPLPVARRPVMIRAVVNAKGTAPAVDAKVRGTLLVNHAQQGVQEVSLASGSATLAFEYRFPSAGEYEMEVLAEGDTHRLDNHRHYLAAVPESRKVLILTSSAGSGS